MKLRPLLFLLACGAGIATRAGSFQAANVPSNAKFVAHLDLQNIRTGKLGSFILEQLAAPEAKTKIDAFSAMIGFDPRLDLHGITLFGTSENPHDAVLLAQGKFDAERLAVLVKANDGYTSSTYGGQTVHSWQDKEKGDRLVRRYGVILNNGLLAMSDGKHSVEALTDVLSQRSSSLAQANGADAPIPSSDAGVIFSAAVDLSGIQNLGKDAEILKKAKGGNISIREQGGQFITQLQVTTSDEQTSNQLHAMMQGMMAFAQLNASNEPDLVKLLQAVSTRVDGSRIQATVTLPADDVIEHLEEEAQKKKL